MTVSSLRFRGSRRIAHLEDESLGDSRLHSNTVRTRCGRYVDRNDVRWYESKYDERMVCKQCERKQAAQRLPEGRSGEDRAGR